MEVDKGEDDEDSENRPTVCEIIEQMQPLHLEAKDALLKAKMIKLARQETCIALSPQQGWEQGRSRD